MSLISRSRIPLALEDVAQMAPAVRTSDLRPLHPERAICVSGYSLRDGIKVRRPPTARLEFVGCLV